MGRRGSQPTWGHLGSSRAPAPQRVLLASRPPTDDRAVYEALSEAIEVARRQGAVALELRATMALARERLGRGGAASDLRNLSAVCAKFSVPRRHARA